MQCKCNKCDDKRYVNEFVDINGVKIMFKVMKDKLSLSHDELLHEINKNNIEMNKKINSLKCDVRYLDKNMSNMQNEITKILDKVNNFNTDNYYTKNEVDDLVERNTGILTEYEIEESVGFEND